jgi:hypothetical protein
MKRPDIAFLVFALLLVPALLAGAQSAAPAGTVVVTYALTRISQIASNQVAVWIEDGNGAFVRTVYVSNFAGRRAGWKMRPQTLRNWVAASNAAGTPKPEIDAVSAATPRTGTVSVTWDLKDAKGAIVPAGTYRYRVEGNISSEKTVLWTGVVRVGATGDSTRATAAYLPSADGLDGKLIT